MSESLNLSKIKETVGINTYDKYQNAIQSLDRLQLKLSQTEYDNQQLDQEKAALPISDWTGNYKYWSKWEDLDEIKQLKQQEEEKINEIYNRTAYEGHVYNHSIEQEFFSKPETEKLNACMHYYNFGNYMLSEGDVENALIHYHTAISYYEYCFPTAITDQEKLDNMRLSCYIQLCHCYTYKQECRKAIDYGTRVINNDSSNNNDTKILAYYYRSRAYRLFDEYDLAEADIHTAISLSDAPTTISTTTTTTTTNTTTTSTTTTDNTHISTDGTVQQAPYDAVGEIAGLSSSSIMQCLRNELKLLQLQKQCSNRIDKSTAIRGLSHTPLSHNSDPDTPPLPLTTPPLLSSHTGSVHKDCGYISILLDSGRVVEPIPISYRI